MKRLPWIIVMLVAAQAWSADAPPSPTTTPAADVAKATTEAMQPAVNTSAPAPDKKAAAKSAGKTAGAQDRLELDTTQITGNRELPRVLYVVPWKRSDLGDLGGKPANSLLDEVLAPVDRDVFKRQNRYYEALKPDAASNAPPGGN